MPLVTKYIIDSVIHSRQLLPIEDNENIAISKASLAKGTFFISHVVTLSFIDIWCAWILIATIWKLEATIVFTNTTKWLYQNARRWSRLPKLAPITNSLMNMLNIERHFPDKFDELQKLCHDHNQTKPTVHIIKYGSGEHNTLHQDLYGDIFFPFQLDFFLNEPR